MCRQRYEKAQKSGDRCAKSHKKNMDLAHLSSLFAWNYPSDYALKQFLSHPWGCGCRTTLRQPSSRCGYIRPAATACRCAVPAGCTRRCPWAMPCRRPWYGLQCLGRHRPSHRHNPTHIARSGTLRSLRRTHFPFLFLTEVWRQSYEKKWCEGALSRKIGKVGSETKKCSEKL